MADTFYWHDYETFGVDPSRDRPVQFAGIRTDAELNEIGEPLELFARPSNDLLPHPDACMVTGISPQQALARGVSERDFIARILEEFMVPGTCAVGYNSLRFDDEVTRYTLYRNFHDPYEREYRNGNSRWDIIDMVRLTHALRPEGIEWPQREDGLPSFRLEELTRANGIGHEAAHDAVADVRATIAIARLIRERQPRLFDYVYKQRGKQEVLAQLDVTAQKPLLHVSGMFGAERHNIALIVPLALHPSNRNEVICCDLGVDPAPLAELSVAELKRRLFSPAAELKADELRPGIKTVRANRCPVLVTPKLLDAASAKRLDIDVEACLRHREAVLAIPDLQQRLSALYAEREFEEKTDPEQMLYSGGFFSAGDRKLMQRVAAASGDQLRDESFPFEDQRLPELLLRYRARNFPQSLTEMERAQWEEFRFQRLTEAEAGASLCLDEYFARIDALREDPATPPERQTLLQDLVQYGDSLLA